MEQDFKHCCRYCHYYRLGHCECQEVNRMIVQTVEGLDGSAEIEIDGIQLQIPNPMGFCCAYWM